MQNAQGGACLKSTVCHASLRRWLPRAGALVVALAMLARTAPGQISPAAHHVVTEQRIERALARVKAGTFTWDDIDAIAEAPGTRAAEAIAALEKMFRNNSNLYGRGMTASCLVRLGDKDDTYWNYLVAKAIPAAEDDAPAMFLVDEKGHTTQKLSPAFRSWAAAHNLTVDQAVEKEAFNGAIIDLGSTKDPRAVPILREALFSANFLVVADAAEGLALIGDKDSIPMIVEACGRFPADVASLIARPLVYFDDEEAQVAVDRYVPKQMASDERKARADGDDPFGGNPFR